MGGLRGTAVLAALLLGAFAAPAQAAETVVALGNSDTIKPSAVTVDPEDIVTWDWVGPDTDHSVEALYGQGEFWDADPGGDGAYAHKLRHKFSHKFTYSGVFRYRCTVHPDTMQGTVTVRGPVAALRSDPSIPIVGRPVTFDAGQSTGSPTRYEWDLDGDGTYELSGTATKQTTTYPTTQRVTVRVRVTDAGKRSSVAVLTVSVRDPAPTAAFLVTPTVARPNQPVTFDASGSTDPDGDIASYEWDLDGDAATGPGGFETPTGLNPTVTRSYTGSGTVDVRLRVTDAAGRNAIAIEQLTLANLAPIADFTSAEGTAGQPVVFDASRSSDFDGEIARYEWDLDGDGSFETDTGGIPRATRAYPAPGTLTVRLRVTDTGGAVAMTSRAVRIAAPTDVTPDPDDRQSASLRVSARAAAVQRVLRSRRAVVRAACTQACTIVARGSLRIGRGRGLPLAVVRRRAPAGAGVTLRLALPRAAATRLRRALAAGRRATVTVTLTATAGTRSRASITRRIAVRR